MTIELLYFDGCPSHEALLPHLRELVARADVPARIELRRVETVEDAERERFLGSPTVRVGGRDVDTGAEGREDYGMKCRLYATDEGLRGTPPDAWILDAIDQAARADSGGWWGRSADDAVQAQGAEAHEPRRVGRRLDREQERVVGDLAQP